MAWDEVLRHLWPCTYLQFAHFVGSFQLSGLQLSCFRKGVVNFVSIVMGGDKSLIKSHSCGDIRRKKKLWSILSHGNFTPFLERLHRHDPNASAQFVSFWHNHKLKIKGLEVEINEDLIPTVTGMSTVGRKFFKDKKSKKEAMV